VSVKPIEGDTCPRCADVLLKPVATVPRCPETEVEPDIFFDNELAMRLRMKPRTFRRLAVSGALDFALLPRFDRKRRWSRALIDQWIAENRRPLRRA
jgi:hypothetical protein